MTKTPMTLSEYIGGTPLPDGASVFDLIVDGTDKKLGECTKADLAAFSARLKALSDTLDGENGTSIWGNKSFDDHVRDTVAEVLEDAKAERMAGKRRAVTDDELVDEVSRRLPPDIWAMVPQEQLGQALKDARNKRKP